MGTSFDPSVSPSNIGIIPRAANHIFKKIDDFKLQAKINSTVEPIFEVQVQFIEVNIFF